MRVESAAAHWAQYLAADEYDMHEHAREKNERRDVISGTSQPADSSTHHLAMFSIRSALPAHSQWYHALQLSHSIHISLRAPFISSSVSGVHAGHSPPSL